MSKTTSQTIKLAEALLRRKELQAKTEQLARIKSDALFEVVAKRVNVTDNVDDLIAKVPKLSAAEVTAEYDFYARQLRLIDAAIQQANWTTDLAIEGVMGDYVPPAEVQG